MKKQNVFVLFSALLSALCSFDAPSALADNSQIQIPPRAAFEIRIRSISGREVLQCGALIQSDDAILQTYAGQVNLVTPQPDVQVFEKVTTERTDDYSMLFFWIGGKLPPIQQQRILQSHGSLDDCWAGVRENLDAQTAIREMK